MSNSNQGDHARFMSWTTTPNLPPKSPTLASDGGASLFTSNNNNNTTTTTTSTKSYHQRTPSASLLVPQPPLSWIDDMLDSPEAPARKIHHRRSASDTAAFLEFPDTSGSASAKLQLLHEDVFTYRSLSLMQAPMQATTSSGGRTPVTPPTPTGDFERLDDEQIISMFSSESDALHRALGGRSTQSMVAAAAVEGMERSSAKGGGGFQDVTTSSPSDSNSGNEMSMEDVKGGGMVKAEAEEVQSLNTSSTVPSPSPPLIGGMKSSSKHPTASSHIDPNMDPKRAKRRRCRLLLPKLHTWIIRGYG